MRSAQQVVVYELQVQEGSGKKSAAGSAGKRKGEQGEEKRSHEHDHVDGVKDSILEPRCVCDM